MIAQIERSAHDAAWVNSDAPTASAGNLGDQSVSAKVAIERVIDGYGMCAGYPKDDIDSVPNQTLHDELTTSHPANHLRSLSNHFPVPLYDCLPGLPKTAKNGKKVWRYPTMKDCPSSPSVADGYCLMLAPPFAGAHTIHFAGKVVLTKAEDGFDSTFTLDITYHLTVQ